MLPTYCSMKGFEIEGFNQKEIGYPILEIGNKKKLANKLDLGMLFNYEVYRLLS